MASLSSFSPLGFRILKIASVPMEQNVLTTHETFQWNEMYEPHIFSTRRSDGTNKRMLTLFEIDFDEIYIFKEPI
jgi:hypothetical protein